MDGNNSTPHDAIPVVRTAKQEFIERNHEAFGRFRPYIAHGDGWFKPRPPEDDAPLHSELEHHRKK